MATYIILFRFTQQGIKNIKESPVRVEAAKKAFRDMGAEVKAFYALLGRYDTAFVVDAPDDETIARAAISISSLGNVSTETMRAFTEDEYRKIISSLP
ncbi:MAG: GYD domain-containing protein [Nitrospirota bacterium]